MKNHIPIKKIKKVSVFCSDGRRHLLKIPITTVTDTRGKHELMDMNDVIKAEKKQDITENWKRGIGMTTERQKDKLAGCQEVDVSTPKAWSSRVKGESY